MILSLSLSSCASKNIKDYKDLDRILRPRANHGLTWQKCVKSDLLGNCKEWDLTVYDITKPETREILNDLHFVCKINTLRYHICVEGDQAGFCHQTFKKRFLSKPKRILLDFIRHNEIQKLRAGDAKCFSINVYSFIEV